MSSNEDFFKWSNEYSVNIKAIDDQHRELVNILNRLFVAVSKREGNEIIAEILDALTNYTKTHFALEEKMLRQANYDKLEEHMEEHRKLLEHFEQLCKKYMTEEKPVYFELLSFLKRWLKEHILSSDKEYSAALHQAGFATADWEREASAEFGRLSDAKTQWWRIWRAA